YRYLLKWLDITDITVPINSLYYIATVNLNRAWTICGLAIRQALTLGLHVRSEADDLEDVEKEHRVRLYFRHGYQYPPSYKYKRG
ncbi:hypothetical protein BJ875DRAFT_412539, partial [Amylocarpus encephaloides]